MSPKFCLNITSVKILEVEWLLLWCLSNSVNELQRDHYSQPWF